MGPPQDGAGELSQMYGQGAKSTNSDSEWQVVGQNLSKYDLLVFLSPLWGAFLEFLAMWLRPRSAAAPEPQS